MKNEKTFDEMLATTLSLMVNIYALAEYADQYFYHSAHEEMDSNELMGNIKFNLEWIETYHFGEDAPKKTDYVRDDYTAAQALIEAMMSMINFMVDYTSPQHIYALLHERANDLAESLIIAITRNGIDTNQDRNMLAYAYLVKGDRAAAVARDYGDSSPLEYLDTDSIKTKYDLQIDKRLKDYSTLFRRIKGEMRSNKSDISTLEAISGHLEEFEAYNSIDTTPTKEIRDIITNRKDGE